jgi:hypothetical protein
MLLSVVALYHLGLFLTHYTTTEREGERKREDEKINQKKNHF